MTGQDFEDRLADGLDRLVGDNGIALLRKQSWSSRRGSFQMEQEADVLLDSGPRDYYAAFECKSRDYGKSRPRGITGLYFSGDYTPDQIEKQVKYRNKSGRRFFVAVEIQNYEGRDNPAFLLPVELFETDAERDLSKVTWEKMAYLGAYLGDGSVEVALDDFLYVESLGAKYTTDYEEIEAWVDEKDEDEGVEPFDVTYTLE